MRIILNDCINPRRAIDLILNKGVDIFEYRDGGWRSEDGLHTNYRITPKGTVSVFQYREKSSISGHGADPCPARTPDLNICPGCGGPADNGHDRGDPPTPYYCSKCNRTKETSPSDNKD